MVVKRGKVVKIDEMLLPAGHTADIQISYKYLGILQSHGNYNENLSKIATSKYHQRTIRS